MEVKARREDLLVALYWTQGIVERRNTMPILANVLMEAQGNSVRVTATDLEVGVRGRLESEVIREGAITVNAKKLYEIVREAPEEMLQFRRLENEWVEVKSGKSIFKIVGMEARDFPQFPQFDKDKLSPIPAAIVREMVEKTLFCASTDETRYNLNGVFVEQGGQGKIRMVATDGHRLALIERGVGAVGLERGVVLPRKGLAELKKLLAEGGEGMMAIGFRENMALVEKGGTELFMRLIEGDFPDYAKVIPDANPHAVKIDQQRLHQALRRVSILSSERYKGIKMELKTGAISISASNPDIGEAVEEIELEYQGKLLTIGFNARYLMDVLAVLGEGGGVEVQFKDELSPSVIRKEGDADYLYVVMPMRL